MSFHRASRHHPFSLLGCPCHSQHTQKLFSRINADLSRRSILKGIAAGFAASGLGLAGTALARNPTRPILFKNVKIFDGVNPHLIEGRAVLVEGRRIKALVEVNEPVLDAEIIDCGGRTLMPGMIDAHWHAILAGISQIAAFSADVPYIHLVAAQEAKRTLLRGFTTIRDMGGPVFALKRAIDEERLAGPRIYPSGAMVSQTAGHGDFRFRADLPRSLQNELSQAERAGISSIADGEADVLRRVREQLLLGASQIKIMGGGGVASVYDPLDALQYTAPEMKAAVAAASDWGTYVAIHAYTSNAVQRALDCGVQSIEHGQLIDEETVKRLVDADAWWSIQPFLEDEDANVYPTEEQRENKRLTAQGTVRAIELGLKYKAKVAVGTDILFSAERAATQGKQLAKFAQWYGNAGLLQRLTSGNAEILALAGARNPYPGSLGRISNGAWADLLVLDGNPLQDISLIADPDRSLKIVMKDGRIHKNTLAV